jgi:hypothetical protein
MKLMVCKGTGAQRISILHPNSPNTKVKRRRIGKKGGRDSGYEGWAAPTS